MAKHLIKLVLGLCLFALFVALAIFALNTENDGGSRAVAAAVVLAIMVYEVRAQQDRRHAELTAKLDRLQKQVDAAREYSSHAALEVQQLRQQIESPSAATLVK